MYVLGDPKRIPSLKEGEEGYTIDPRNNAKRSYMAAGYKAVGHSAEASGYSLLRKLEIRTRIDELRKEERSLADVKLRHWKTLLCKAQSVLERAVDGEEIPQSQINAAKEIIEQAQGPTRFRFGVDKGADTDGSINVTLWSGSRE